MYATHRASLATTLVLLLIALAGCGDDPPPPATGPELVWSDEFDGGAGVPPDPASWVHETYGDGSGNAELQCYTDKPTNAGTDGRGHLVITARRAPGHRCVDDTVNDFTSARLTTQGLRTWTYGRFEMRAQVPAGVGTWPAFWALGANLPEVGWPAAGEIDAMEYVGRDPTRLLGTIHGPRADGSHWYLDKDTQAAAPLHEDFHVYAVEWGEDQLTWSLDGETYATTTRAEAEAEGRWVFDKPFYLLLNLAVGGSLGGEVPATTAFPQRYVIDYVRVYQ